MLFKPTYSKKTAYSYSKKNILVRKSPELVKKRRNWFIAISSLPLFGMVTAFGIAPNTSPQNVQVEWVTQSLSLPTVSTEVQSDIKLWRHEGIRRGDTILAILARLGVNDQDTKAFLQAARTSKAMRQLRPGKTVYAHVTTDGELLMFRYFFGQEELFLMEKVGHAFKMTEQEIQLDTYISMKSGVIKSSLFAATDQAGIPNNIATQLTDIFASDIDFHRDLHNGDQFKIVYETLLDNGEQAKVGRILAAEFVNKNKSYQAIFFESAYGESGYYTPSGKSLRKEFLRAPLAFSRVSSGFSKRRFHPILKKWRSHKGVDYAAPHGTPIYATANGTVASVSTQRGYGKLIVLKHRGHYDTAYGHLSRFAKGMHRGKRVKQGDIIGYVGSTGLATGPHLHYELRISGVQVDPTALVLPRAPRLALQELNDFHKDSKSLVARLNIMRGNNGEAQPVIF